MTKTYKIVASGLLIALSILLTRVFSANILILGVPAFRIAAGFLPIMLAGLLLGPWLGMAVGAAADALGFLFFPSGYYFPPITLTSMLVGLLPYLAYRFIRLDHWLRLLIAVGLTQILCSMLLQTYWLTLLYGKSFEALFYPRAIAALATIPVYFALLYAILAALRKANLAPPLQKQKAP